MIIYVLKHIVHKKKSYFHRTSTISNAPLMLLLCQKKGVKKRNSRDLKRYCQVAGAWIMHFETPHRRHIRLWYQLFEFWGRPHKKCHTSKNLSISSNNFQTLKFRRYDVIVRMETFFEDSSYLIERYIALLVGLSIASTTTNMNTFYRIYVRSYNSYRTNRCKIFQLEGPGESARAVRGRPYIT